MSTQACGDTAEISEVSTKPVAWLDGHGNHTGSGKDDIALVQIDMVACHFAQQPVQGLAWIAQYEGSRTFSGDLIVDDASNRVCAEIPAAPVRVHRWSKHKVSRTGEVCNQLRFTGCDKSLKSRIR